MSMDASIPPSIPFHVTRAYGPSAGVRPVQPAARVAAPSAVKAAAKIEPSSRLVAATVPGKVDFRADGPQPGAGGAALPMYRHPADKNQAATAIQLGRSLDVSG
ncbi:MAG: hypothetical protein ACREJO_01220 [Phycisphaerales bacterium]